MSCEWSGQSINFEKSKLFCSPNNPAHIAADMARICGSPSVEDLGMYLGIPLIHTKVKHIIYGRESCIC